MTRSTWHNGDYWGFHIVVIVKHTQVLRPLYYRIIVIVIVV